MHSHGICRVARKNVLIFKPIQGRFWQECICSQGVQMWWISKPLKNRGRLQGRFGGVWGLFGKSAPKVQKSAGASEWLKVASTQKWWLMAVLRDGKDPENFATCIAHHGALALKDTSVIAAEHSLQWAS